jgi:hypothetical protein
MQKNKLYTFVALACLAAGVYLFFAVRGFGGYAPTGFTGCIFKTVTGYPCPSCGSTRAIRLLIQGDFCGALQMNPLGIVSALLLVTVPLWLLYDLTFGKHTLFDAYQRFELTVRVRWIAAILILLVLANWYWNIQKNL